MAQCMILKYKNIDVKNQQMFTKLIFGVVKASYGIAQQTAMSSKSFSEMSFVKTCMFIAVQEI